MIKIFYDLETTGTDDRKHAVHQIAGFIEMQDEIIEEFNIKTRPHDGAEITSKALEVGGVTEEQIMEYQPIHKAYAELIRMLSRFIAKYDKKHKAHLVGYNNRGFDDKFLRMWFEANNDKYMGSWFWADTLDVMVLASQYLLSRRSDMPNFQLKTVAAELGIEVDETKLHDASYDVVLTRQIYRIVTGLDFEI